MSNAEVGFWRRALRRTVMTTLTAITLAAAGGAVVAGRTVLAERAAAAPVPEPAALMTVATRHLTMDDGFDVKRRFAGEVEPLQESALAFEIPGEISAIDVDEGDEVVAGQRLATLDTRLLKAEEARLKASRDALQSQQELARRTMDRRSTLQQNGFTSSQALDEASLSFDELSARLAAVDAELEAAAVRLAKSELRAPFGGVVRTRSIDAGSVAQMAAPVLTLVETRAPRFRVGLAPALLKAAREADGLSVHVGGQDYPVAFVAALPSLDPATRTRPVLFRFLQDDVPAFGETGELTLTDRVAGRGAWVDNTALLDDVRGLWRVLIIEEDAEGRAVVGTEAVHVIHAEAGRSYVRGSFQDGAEYVADGVHRVMPGERVEVVAATGVGA